MTLRTLPRPHAVRSRAGSLWSSSLHRLVVGILVCACATSFVVWRSSIKDVEDGFVKSLSGHRYHPKLCGSLSTPSETNSSSSSSSSSSSADIDNSGCSELHDPHLADEVVRVPSSLQLLSGHTELTALQQLLQRAVDQHWPLALARRVTALLLQAVAPPVYSSSAADDTDGQQHEQYGALPLLTAAESGHPAGRKFTTQALAVLRRRSAGQLVPCSFDPSLPTDFSTHFLFTAVWPTTTPSSDSSRTPLANAVTQLLSAMSRLASGSTYISVYVPSDAAADSLVWLDLLQLLAAPLGVPVHLVHSQAASNTTAADASDPPQPQQLSGTSTSQAYNAALSAFFPVQQTSAAGTAAPSAAQESGQLDNGRNLHAQQRQGGPSALSHRGAGISHGSCPAGAPAPGCYQPEFVVLFAPQLYFCAADLVRLMEYPEVLACGVQLNDHKKPAQLLRRQHRHRQLRTAANRMLQQQQEEQQQEQQQHQGAAATGVQEGPMAAAVAAAGQAVLKPEVPPEFEMQALRAAHDAAREISGDLLRSDAPYFSHGPSQALVQAGLPVPMYCCWGGVIKLRAAPLAAGLRFRGGEEGECHPSDPMSLMCDDLWRTGHSRIILDPGVRTSSQLRTKSLFEHPRFPFFYYTHNWETTAWFDIHPLLPLQYWNTTASTSSSVNSSSNADAADAGYDVQQVAAVWTAADWQPGAKQMCCEGLLLGGAGPNQPTDCRRVSALSGKNFTSLFLQRCAAGLHHRQGSGLGADCG